MNNQVSANTFDVLGKLPGAILAVVSVALLLGFAFYVWKVFRKVKSKEVDIFETKDQIDNLEKTLAKKMNGYVSQPQLDKMVEKERQPLEAKLEKLKMERQFLLDKVSIFGLLKK